MQGEWSLLVVLCWSEAILAVVPASEHKIHNIVLYPDKHSWCKTTEIKQIVTFPKCNSVEIDNNVCVGACFSYTIPQSAPAAPGDVITPYCDSCQPQHYTWKEVKLTCESDDDEEAEGSVEMIKRVQVITNCTCASCHHVHVPHHHHKQPEAAADVPELMSLMMQHNNHNEPDLDKEESVTHTVIAPERKEEIENIIDVDEEKEKEMTDEVKEENKLEVVHVNKQHSEETPPIVNVQGDIGEHVQGPHHSLILQPHTRPEHHEHGHYHHHHHDHDSEQQVQVPSLLKNQFKIHEHEEFPDQLAVESRKEFTSEFGPAVMTVPDLIFKEHRISQEDKRTDDPSQPSRDVSDEKSDASDSSISHHSPHKAKGVKIVEVPHEHLAPALEGTHISYMVKSDHVSE